MCKKCKQLGATTVVPRISLDRPIPVDQFLGVRKGAWAEDEDCRLRKCVEEYGEGNWRQVPLRAGLNRCRKSCRLRWLNYLHPEIKRGEFASDEIDLIIRMHNLLGNRWSLIAGRIPGRTANDIKNYWNTYIRKTLLPKSSSSNKEKKPMELQTTTTKIEVLRPQPRTFSKNLVSMKSTTVQPGGETPNKPAMEMFKELDDPEWWEGILFDKDVDGCGKGQLPNFDIHDIEAQADGKIASGEEEGVWYDLCLSAMDTWAP